MSKEKFPIKYDLEPDGYYSSRRFKPNISKREEITSDQPIQVRINNGPWVYVRPSDLNKSEDNT